MGDQFAAVVPAMGYRRYVEAATSTGVAQQNGNSFVLSGPCDLFSRPKGVLTCMRRSEWDGSST